MSLLRRNTSTRLGTMLLAGGLTVGFVVADGAAMMSSASAAPNLAGLRACESGGNYATNTGNGYYGAYQFSASTWHSLGLSGLPSQASAASQDAAVLKLAARSGWSQWPVCSRTAGSSGTSSAPARASRGTTRAPLPAATSRSHVTKPVTRPVARPAAAPAAHPAFPAGLVLTAERDHYRPEVRAWQARMAARGWTITVDGYFGPQSAAVAAAFVAEKHLDATPGSLNGAGYDAAWTLAVTR